MSTINVVIDNIVNNGLIIGLILMTFLVLKEVFNEDKDKNKKIQSFNTIINIAIIPLFIAFIVIVLDKAVAVLIK